MAPTIPTLTATPSAFRLDEASFNEAFPSCGRPGPGCPILCPPVPEEWDAPSPAHGSGNFPRTGSELEEFSHWAPPGRKVACPPRLRPHPV
ncbi:hypothetical protein GCM10020256_51210 [Streptomyces thermocoprophilus]